MEQAFLAHIHSVQCASGLSYGMRQVAIDHKPQTTSLHMHVHVVGAITGTDEIFNYSSLSQRTLSLVTDYLCNSV